MAETPSRLARNRISVMQLKYAIKTATKIITVKCAIPTTELSNQESAAAEN